MTLQVSVHAACLLQESDAQLREELKALRAAMAADKATWADKTKSVEGNHSCCCPVAMLLLGRAILTGDTGDMTSPTAPK